MATRPWATTENQPLQTGVETNDARWKRAMQSAPEALVKLEVFASTTSTLEACVPRAVSANRFCKLADFLFHNSTPRRTLKLSKLCELPELYCIIQVQFNKRYSLRQKIRKQQQRKTGRLAKASPLLVEPKFKLSISFDSSSSPAQPFCLFWLCEVPGAPDVSSPRMVPEFRR